MKARALGAAFVLAIAGASAADVLGPQQRPRPAGIVLEQRGGTLACPYGVFARGRAYLDLFNTGDGETAARVSILPDRGKPSVAEIRLPAGKPTGVQLHGKVTGGGMVIVEYAGGPVVASHSAWFRRGSGPGPGAVAGSCMRAEAAQLVIARMSTVGTESALAIANPGGADADVSITLLADGRRLRPESLTRRVVPARSRRVFRLGDYAFDAGDLTAVIEARAGRVVAEALVEPSSGVYLLGGHPAAVESTLVAGLAGSEGSFSVVSVGDEDAGIASRLLTSAGQGKAPGVPTALAPGGSVRTQVGSRVGSTSSAYRFSVTVGSPVWSAAAWRRSSRNRNDVAAAEAMVASRGWSAVVGVRSPGAGVRVIVANPSDAAATVTLRVSTRAGASDRAITLEPGRLASVPLGRGTGPYGVVLTSDVPIAALIAGAGEGGSIGFPATSFPPAIPIAVQIKPRAGVPA